MEHACEKRVDRQQPVVSEQRAGLMDRSGGDRTRQGGDCAVAGIILSVLFLGFYALLLLDRLLLVFVAAHEAESGRKPVIAAPRAKGSRPSANVLASSDSGR